MRRAAVALLAAYTMAASATTAMSAAAPPTDDCLKNNQICGEAEKDHFKFGRGSSGDDSPQGDSSSTKSGSDAGAAALSETVRLYDYAPACSGNDRTGDLLCTGAVSKCLRPGYISYWVWVKEVYRSSGAIVPGGDWDKQANEVCLGPGDDGISVDDAIAGYLASEFQRLMILKADVHAQPDGATLVNYETGFYTTASSYHLPQVQVLGVTVDVVAHAKQYDWTFGDGTVLTDGGPGARDTLQVQHTYRRNGTFRITLGVEWTGTYQVNGGPVRDVFGTARTTSAPQPLQVKQARSELVTR